MSPALHPELVEPLGLQFGEESLFRADLGWAKIRKKGEMERAGEGRREGRVQWT